MQHTLEISRLILGLLMTAVVLVFAAGIVLDVAAEPEPAELMSTPVSVPLAGNVPLIDPVASDVAFWPSIVISIGPP